MSRRRILMISSHAGTLTHFRGPVLRAFVAAGHEVHAASAGPAPEAAATLAAWGIRYHPLPLDRAGLNPLADLRAFRSVFDLVALLRPDVVFAYQIKAVVYGLWAARRAGIAERYAMIEGLGWAFGGTTSARRLITRVARGLYRFALAGARAVFFVNPDD